jgi:hypothetical protein
MDGHLILVERQIAADGDRAIAFVGRQSGVTPGDDVEAGGEQGRVRRDRGTELEVPDGLGIASGAAQPFGGELSARGGGREVDALRARSTLHDDHGDHASGRPGTACGAAGRNGDHSLLARWLFEDVGVGPARPEELRGQHGVGGTRGLQFGAGGLEQSNGEHDRADESHRHADAERSHPGVESPKESIHACLCGSSRVRRAARSEPTAIVWGL